MEKKISTHPPVHIVHVVTGLVNYMSIYVLIIKNGTRGLSKKDKKLIILLLILYKMIMI